jgi:dihydroorotate dehydrogenase (fumarate)
LNSAGIPCQSPEYYEKCLPNWVKRSEDKGKPFVLSVAGTKRTDYRDSVRLAVRSGVKIIEINFGCPNLTEDKVQKPIFSYDLDEMGMVLDIVSQEVEGANIDIWVKLSWLEPTLLKKVARMMVNYPMIRAIVTTNALANCFDCDDEGHNLISPNNGLAGLSGPAMRPIGMGQVRQWRQALNDYVIARESIEVIGVGGIDHGRYALKYLSAGSTAVQVGTAAFDKGAKVFSTMLQQIDEIFTRRA